LIFRSQHFVKHSFAGRAEVLLLLTEEKVLFGHAAIVTSRHEAID
jgi:Tat protein secretion system quality control protein TatD with DNase activity